MDIEEFSRCLGLSDEVLTSVDEVVHASLMKMIHLYLVVGGMPAAVQAYVDTNDLNVVEEKQKEIIDLYKWDISQYDPNKKLDINEIFNLIPSELDAKNKRFILKNLNEKARFSRYENSFLWLKNAGVAIPALNIQEPTFSFKLNELRNLFKLFQNDVGLLTSQYASGIQLQLLQGEVKQNYGAIYENLVAEEFTEILHYNHIAGFWQYETVFLQHSQNRISMDIIDFTEEIKLSVSYYDTQRFHHTLIDGYLCHRRKRTIMTSCPLLRITTYTY